MTWLYNDEIVNEIPEKTVGFVYEIIHIPTGKYYIGKKLFFFRKTKSVKGKKKKVLVESDWMDYYGSSDEVKNLVENDGPKNFVRRIIKFCSTKAELSYVEAREQFLRDALLDDNSFNSWISVRVRKAHLNSMRDRLNEK